MFIFVDCETLGKKEASIILSIGLIACPDDYTMKSFKDAVYDGLYITLSKKEQYDLGRTVDQSTLDWWDKQGAEAKSVLNPSKTLSLKNFNQTVWGYLNSKGFNKKTAKIWSRGMIDAKWWHHLYDYTLPQVDPKAMNPFDFWMWRDTRTALELVHGDPNGQPMNVLVKKDEFIKHNALHDAALDCWRMYLGDAPF